MNLVNYWGALQNLWGKKRQRLTSVVTSSSGSECFGSRGRTQTTLAAPRRSSSVSSVSRLPFVSEERTVAKMSETREEYKLGDLVWCVSILTR